MYTPYKAGIAALLTFMLAGTLTACGPRTGTNNGANTQSQTYRVNQYGTNGTTVNDNLGIRPYGTQQYGVRPDMASTYPYPNASPFRYNAYSVSPSVRSNPMYDQKKAEQMARLAANVEGVTRATAVVQGKDAVIGIEGATAANMKMLERSVHQAMKRAEPGYTVHVTADKNLTQRIRTLSTQIGGAGTRALRTAGQDFSVLVRDIGRTITSPFR